MRAVVQWQVTKACAVSPERTACHERHGRRPDDARYAPAAARPAAVLHDMRNAEANGDRDLRARGGEEAEEGAVVARANGGAHPGAEVVEAVDNDVGDAAVVRAGGPVEVICVVVLYWDRAALVREVAYSAWSRGSCCLPAGAAMQGAGAWQSWPLVAIARPVATQTTGSLRVRSRRP